MRQHTLQRVVFGVGSVKLRVKRKVKDHDAKACGVLRGDRDGSRVKAKVEGPRR